MINVNSHKPHVYFNITPGIINRLDGVNGPCYSLSNERYFELIRREFETKWKFGMPSGASSQQTIPYHQKPQKRLFEIVKFPSHLKRQKKKDISRVIKHGGISKKNSSPLTPPIHSLFVTKDGFAFQIPQFKGFFPTKPGPLYKIQSPMEVLSEEEQVNLAQIYQLDILHVS